MEGEYSDELIVADGKCSNVPSPLSWSTLLKGSVIVDRLSPSLSYYVKLSLQNAKRIESLPLPSEHQSHIYEKSVHLQGTNDPKSDLHNFWKEREFHIALITQKYPVTEKFSRDMEKQWAFDVEVVFLPYNLLIHQDNAACHDSVTMVSKNLDFGSGKVGETFVARGHGIAHERHKKEGLGSSENESHAYHSKMSHSGFRIECHVHCLVECEPSS